MWFVVHFYPGKGNVILLLVCLMLIEFEQQWHELQRLSPSRTGVFVSRIFTKDTYSFFAVRVRRACWAFLIFSSLALCCASVGFLLSGTLGLSFASNTSPSTWVGFDPRASINLLASSVSATNVSPSIWASSLLISHACVSQDPLLLLPARRRIWPFSPTSS